ncbi:MAG: thioredoxin domain-containing protein [Chloroflexi bacterium]|nr:thioredoxin domain-containing protein [Chloroflexota bacterium]
MADFQFSHRPNQASAINWRSWSPAAFEEARAKDKPILLAISARWCHWCHLMDETTYSDPEVARLLNEHYLPLRVDSDRRPDVNSRYNQSGWPSTVLLTPDGDVMTGETFLNPEHMRRILADASMYYRTKRSAIYAKVSQEREKREAAARQARIQGALQVKPASVLSQPIVGDVVEQIGQAVDPKYGGFGGAPKFPQPEALTLLLWLYCINNDGTFLQVIAKTLDSMAAGQIHDQVEGGFFRYVAKEDWSEPHTEKLLEVNATLADNYLHAYYVTRQQRFAEVARKTLGYLDRVLLDPQRGVFCASQCADPDYHQLSAEARAQAVAPPVDRVVLTNWNALAAMAYLRASWVLPQPRYQELALGCLDWLWENCWDPELGMHHYHDGQRQAPGILADHAYYAKACLDAYELTGQRRFLERCEAIGAVVRRTFACEDGLGFYDIVRDPQANGLMRVREKAFRECATLAQVFARLFYLTSKQEYERLAFATVQAFSTEYADYTFYAGDYGLASARLTHPWLKVDLVGRASDPVLQQLRSAALSIRYPNTVMQTLDPAESERLAQSGYQPEVHPAAYICVGQLCSLPVRDVGGFQAAVSQMLRPSLQGMGGGPSAEAPKP